MGIAQKHSYRFGFLRSEWWSNFRVAQIARAGGQCYVCGGREKLDVHHLLYRPNPYETKWHEVRVLCRGCHDLAHENTTPKSYKSLTVAVRAFNAFFKSRMHTGPRPFSVAHRAHAKAVRDDLKARKAACKKSLTRKGRSRKGRTL